MRNNLKSMIKNKDKVTYLMTNRNILNIKIKRKNLKK